MPKNKLNSFYTVESFSCYGDIVLTSTDPVQLRWPQCNSASDLIAKLEILTKAKQQFNKRNLDGSIFGVLFVVCRNGQ